MIFENLEEEDKEILNKLAKEEDISTVEMSNKSGEGIGGVKSKVLYLILYYFHFYLRIYILFCRPVKYF